MVHEGGVRELAFVFRRIQFTPDLLPADVVGTLIYSPSDGEFTTKKGPIFTNLLLADEINRAPAKVQSALLEGMQERQVTIGDVTYPLPEPFLVLATENPIDQEGTYPLPEAQTDRFMLKLKIDYPGREDELLILENNACTKVAHEVSPVIDPDSVFKAREFVDQVYMDDKLKGYVVDVVLATRDPVRYGAAELEAFVRFGASPRATISLALAAKALAFMEGRSFVTPQDVKNIGPDVLRHRVGLSYRAEAEVGPGRARRGRVRAAVPDCDGSRHGHRGFAQFVKIRGRNLDPGGVRKPSGD